MKLSFVITARTNYPPGILITFNNLYAVVVLRVLALGQIQFTMDTVQHSTHLPTFRMTSIICHRSLIRYRNRVVPILAHSVATALERRVHSDRFNPQVSYMKR